MAKFALIFSYTDEAWARMIDNPNDRANLVRAVVEQFGGAVESLYYMFGDHDGILICEFPDATDAGAFSLLVNSSGAFRSVQTHQLIPSSEMPTVLAKAAKAKHSYVKPGE